MAKVIRKIMNVHKSIDKTLLPVNPPKEPSHLEQTLQDRERCILLSEFPYYSMDFHASLMASCRANDLASDLEVESLDEEEGYVDIPNLSVENLSAYLNTRLKNPITLPESFMQILGSERSTESKVLTREEATRIIDYLLKAYERLMELRNLSMQDLQSEYRRARKQSIENFMVGWLKTAQENDDLSFLSDGNLSDDKVKEWLKYDNWKGEEAIALSFGKNPMIVNIANLHKLTLPSLFLEDFTKRFDFLVRSDLNLDALEPQNFINWCREKDFDLPRELTTGHRKISAKTFDEMEKRVEELEQVVAAHEALVEDIDTRSRKSLFALVLGMAIDGYVHKIGEGGDETAYSEATKVIAESVSNLGYSLTQKTVKTWLTKCEKDQALHKMIASIRKHHPEKVSVKKLALKSDKILLLLIK